MRMTTLTGFFLLASLVVGVSAAPAPLQIDDFAYGVHLVTPPKAGLVKILLPGRIYRDLAHADGADLRVFAMDGRMIPHYMPPPGANDSRPHELFFEIRSAQAVVLAYGNRRVSAVRAVAGFSGLVAGAPHAALRLRGQGAEPQLKALDMPQIKSGSADDLSRRMHTPIALSAAVPTPHRNGGPTWSDPP